MDANLILGLTSIAASMLGNKKTKLPEMQRTETPNLKMMDETTVNNQKEEVITAGRAMLDNATKNIKQTANAASGLRSGKVYENMFDVSGKIAAETASKMNDIDMQAMQFNNNVLTWIANFNAAQNAAIAGRQFQQAQLDAQYKNDTSSGLASIGQSLLTKDKEGNYINDLSSIFGGSKAAKTVSDIGLSEDVIWKNSSSYFPSFFK